MSVMLTARESSIVSSTPTRRRRPRATLRTRTAHGSSSPLESNLGPGSMNAARLTSPIGSSVSHSAWIQDPEV